MIPGGAGPAGSVADVVDGEFVSRQEVEVSGGRLHDEGTPGPTTPEWSRSWASTTLRLSFANHTGDDMVALLDTMGLPEPGRRLGPLDSRASREP